MTHDAEAMLCEVCREEHPAEESCSVTASERLPMFTKNGADCVLKTVEIFCETGPFAHLAETTMQDIALLVEAMDESQLGQIGLEPACGHDSMDGTGIEDLWVCMGCSRLVRTEKLSDLFQKSTVLSPDDIKELLGR